MCKDLMLWCDIIRYLNMLISSSNEALTSPSQGPLTCIKLRSLKMVTPFLSRDMPGFSDSAHLLHLDTAVADFQDFDMMLSNESEPPPITGRGMSHKGSRGMPHDVMGDFGAVLFHRFHRLYTHAEQCGRVGVFKPWTLDKRIHDRPRFRIRP